MSVPKLQLKMLCATCRRSLLARLPTFRHHVPLLSRSVATAPATSNAAPTNPPPPPTDTTAVLSSSFPGISQPLSTPHLSPSTPANAASAPGTKSRKVRSSVAGGAVLQGLGYTKAKPQILAKEDEEYPEWLWSVLDEKGGAAGVGVDVAALTKKQRAKYDRKQSKLMKEVLPSIPVHEQSKDLTKPGDDAVTSLDRRQEIVRSSRVARRKGIREDNFLRGL